MHEKVVNDLKTEITNAHTNQNSEKTSLKSNNLKLQIALNEHTSRLGTLEKEVIASETARS